MKHLCHLVRKYPVSCLIIAVIWIICLIPIPENPLSDVSMIDKWTHLAMYGSLCIVIWMEYLRRHKDICKIRLFVGGVLAPLLMGGLIELAQAYCTCGTRSGDWIDFAADGIGVLIGVIISCIIIILIIRKRKLN